MLSYTTPLCESLSNILLANYRQIHNEWILDLISMYRKWKPA